MTREEAIAYLEDPFPLSNSLSIECRLELHDKALKMAIEALKAQSSQPEPHYDEWCTDCKEYDHERHCCPRWNRVIRETLKDAQSERKTGYWIDDGIVGYGALMIEYHGVKCDQCGWSTSLLIPRNFCPKCGAYMKGEEEE